MIGVDIGIVIIALASLASLYRMLIGPTDADRAIAGDLLMFCVIGLVALMGLRMGSTATFDLVLIAALLGFLGAVSLSRALTRGRR